MRKLFLILLFTVISAQVHSDILSEDLMQVCEVIGYESKTEEFGTCVLALRNKVKLNKIATLKQREAAEAKASLNRIEALKQQHREAAEAKFAEMHEQQQRQYQQKLSYYRQQQQQYEAQQVKIQKEKERKQNLALMEMGLRMMGGQTIQDSISSTAGTLPIPQAPTAPSLESLQNQNHRITLPNGSFFDCTYNPTFKTTNCN